MKILLIHLPFVEENFYKKDFFSPDRQGPLLPIGIATIASFIREKGHAVEILDIYAEQMDYGKVIATLKNKSYDIIGISALVTQYAYFKRLTRDIKNIKDIPIVLGGGLATASYQVVLAHVPEADICVLGEGEETISELLAGELQDLKDVSGIAFRYGDRIIRNPPRQLINNLDTLPYPAYDLLKITNYFNTKFLETGVFNVRTKYSRNLRVLPMLTGRGCPYNCNFCGKAIPGTRFRSVPNIIAEIDFLKNNYGIQGIHFVDELFVIDRKRTLGLCTELKKRNLVWDCQGRVNTVDAELLRAMKDSGCVAVGLGIESGSQKILDNMNKGITVGQIRTAVNACKKVGLSIKCQLIFGYPGETAETIEETVGLMKELQHPGRRFQYITPIPGTKLYQEAMEKNMIGDEEKWLYRIQESFDTMKPAINFTSFKTEKIRNFRRYYYNKMVFNHLIYLFRHPGFLLNSFIRNRKSVAELFLRSLFYMFKLDFLRK